MVKPRRGNDGDDDTVDDDVEVGRLEPGEERRPHERRVTGRELHSQRHPELQGQTHKHHAGGDKQSFQ